MSTATTHIKTEKQLIPTLRFNEFEDLWRTRKLGELGSVVNGLTYSPNDINDNGTLVLRSSNVQNGALYLDDNVYVTVIEGKYNPVLVDDILICVRNGSKRLIGKNTLITEEVKGVAFGAFMAVYRSDFNRFLYYFFSSQGYYKEIHKNLGATINSINGSDLRKFKVGVPSLPEQQKIASFLSAVDEKIQQLTKKKALLEQYKKGVMQQLFSGQLRFKDENENPYPDWEEKKMGDIMAVRNDQAPKSEEYPLMAFIKHVGVAPKGERYNREFLVNDGDGKKYKKTEYGDFIYSSNNLDTGSIGLNRYGSACISPVYSIFQIKELCDYQFISKFLVRKSFINKMLRFRQGVVYGQWKIHESAVLTIKEKIPCLEEQQKIATYLSSIDTKIEAVNNQITQTQTFKKGLLQQMFV